MTQQTIDFPERLSLCDKLEAYLKARAGVWIDGRDFERVAGAYGWRTRLSDLRRKRGMRIENRVRTIKRDGYSFKVSEYLYVDGGTPDGSLTVRR